MPVKRDNYSIVPIHLEPVVKEQLDSVCREVGSNRAKFLRMMVKYVIDNKTTINDIMKHGDPPPKQ